MTVETTKEDTEVETLKLFEQIQQNRADLDTTIRELAGARGKYYTSGQSSDLRQSIEKLEEKAQTLLSKSEQLTNQLQKVAGISDELIETIEREARKGDEDNKIFRRQLTQEQIAPTDKCEELLPDALDAIHSAINKKWLDTEKSKYFHLGQEFLKSPFSLFKGMRLESEFPKIHRFAQAIIISEDFLNDRDEYDFMAGALLVPQTTQLGLSLDLLGNTKGAKERFRALSKLPSRMSDATTFELLVGAACTEGGRDVEFLPERSSISPDLKIHDYPFPTVVECKRKRPFTEYELNEEKQMKKVFHALSESVARTGLWGVFSLSLCDEPGKVPIQDIVDCALRQRFSYAPHFQTEYDWGSIAYSERPEKISIRSTRLYSPSFLQDLFMWNSDLPEYDGIICQVKPTNDIRNDFVERPIGLLWKVTSTKATKKRSWTPRGLYTEAIQQVRPGEAGIFYLCYQEGTREEISDRRLQEFVKSISSMEHSAAIRLPAFILTRLYPRALNDGGPDLIESGVQFLSSYADPIYFDDFPTTVFTRLRPDS